MRLAEFSRSQSASTRDSSASSSCNANLVGFQMLGTMVSYSYMSKLSRVQHCLEYLETMDMPLHPSSSQADGQDDIVKTSHHHLHSGMAADRCKHVSAGKFHGGAQTVQNSARYEEVLELAVLGCSVLESWSRGFCDLAANHASFPSLFHENLEGLLIAPADFGLRWHATEKKARLLSLGGVGTTLWFEYKKSFTSHFSNLIR